MIEELSDSNRVHIGDHRLTWLEPTAHRPARVTGAGATRKLDQVHRLAGADQAALLEQRDVEQFQHERAQPPSFTDNARHPGWNPRVGVRGLLIEPPLKDLGLRENAGDWRFQVVRG